MNGVTGLRPWETKKSKYCSKNECIEVFDDLIENAKCGHILVSYNTDGIIPSDVLEQILQNKGDVTIHWKPLIKFKSHSRGKSKNHKFTQERIFHVRVNRKPMIIIPDLSDLARAEFKLRLNNSN